MISCCLPWSDVSKTDDQDFQQKDQASSISSWRLGDKVHHFTTRRPQRQMDYEGPFVVKRVCSSGAMMLATMNGEDFPHPINADIVKKYYA